MATSSSEESNSAPTDFNISSLTGSNNGKASFIYEKCPLCARCRRTFYCRDCVANGNITHSKATATCPERLAEKKLKLYRLTKEKAKYLENCQELFERKRRLDSIQTEAHQYTQRTKLLRLAIQSTAVKVEKEKQELTKLQEKIDYYLERRKTHVNKVQKIQRYTVRCQREIKVNQEKLESTRDELKAVVRENVQQLISYIFPITEVVASPSDDSVESAVTELAEAQQTNYIKGHWVLTSNSRELQYRIVEPCLSGSGDYTAYPVWVTEHKDTMPATVVDGEQRNPAYDIIAALTHTAQLISVLVYFLDVRLPKTLSFSEFCGHELTEQQFMNKVAKLNANIIYLCLSQNVNPRLLHPHQTILNLLLLLNPEASDLGRCGPIEVNPSLIESMEESLAKDLSFVDEVYDEKNSDEEELNGDWETVPNLQTSEIPSVPSTISYAGQAGAYSQLQPSNATTSLADGFFSAAASVASLWRAATGHNK